MDKEKKIVNKVGRPPVGRDTLLRKLEPFLKVGYSLSKACIFAKVPIRTAYDYYQKDEDFRNEVDRLRNMVNILARQIIINSLQEKKDVNLALEWLDRMEKDEFSKRVEISTTETTDPLKLLKELFSK